MAGREMRKLLKLLYLLISVLVRRVALATLDCVIDPVYVQRVTVLKIASIEAQFASIMNIVLLVQHGFVSC
jgi:hypothetical protein